MFLMVLSLMIMYLVGYMVKISYTDILEKKVN